MNVAVNCPQCSVRFDAAPGIRPGAPVRIDTVGGRLQVMNLLSSLERAELLQLRALVEAAKDTGQIDEKAVAEVSPQVASWLAAPENRREVRETITLLLAVLAFMISALNSGSTPAPRPEPAPAPTVIVQLPPNPVDPPSPDPGR